MIGVVIKNLLSTKQYFMNIRKLAVQSTSITDEGKKSSGVNSHFGFKAS